TRQAADVGGQDAIGALEHEKNRALPRSLQACGIAWPGRGARRMVGSEETSPHGPSVTRRLQYRSSDAPSIFHHTRVPSAERVGNTESRAPVGPSREGSALQELDRSSIRPADKCNTHPWPDCHRPSAEHRTLGFELGAHCVDVFNLKAEVIETLMWMRWAGD